ncbi:Peptidylprolyl isomerase [Sphingomonas antarctica]|uniref:hypothetical protein n=1 Tax=Sphingomonas antarctica TaxID=2040274 RepID=UPI0039ECD2B4
MKAIITILAVALATPALAQTATPAPAAPMAAAKFNLDTPIEQIVADPKAKTVLDADLPGLTTNEKYEMFKGMSLNQVAGFAPDKMTPERLAKTAADLAPLK